MGSPARPKGSYKSMQAATTREKVLLPAATYTEGGSAGAVSLTSPNGTVWELTVGNDGAITTVSTP